MSIENTKHYFQIVLHVECYFPNNRNLQQWLPFSGDEYCVCLYHKLNQALEHGEQG